MFKLNMEPFGGKGTRKGELPHLVELFLFRVGLQFEPHETEADKWVVLARRRGGRKTWTATSTLPTKEAAVSEFFWNLIRLMPSHQRSKYFDVMPISKNRKSRSVAEVPTRNA
ncbi:hypothetical protein AU381_23495 [Sinorhizobium glycinis]|uniref:Uncharacterized protein n=1 Tax=Sinorhizobium glycinis TaxID=1472378 RepID=A0A178XTM2_9HYPH|nr:hypothetical protein AU381_23495 [Sinorhizobium glycinis]